MLTEDSPEVRELVRARLRRAIAELDYRRAMVRVVRAGAGRQLVARALGSSQDAVQGALSRAVDVSMPVQGFSGATPMEICRRFAAGLIEREQLIGELAAFPYSSAERDPYDDVSPDPPGGWSEVEFAENLGLIDDSVYTDVFTRRHPEASSGEA